MQVLSVSFLPWVLLLLAIVMSIPIVGMVESSRRKKQLEAERAQQPAEPELGADDASSQGYAAEGMQSPGDAFGGDGFGSSQGGVFDDDPFK